MRRTVGAGFSGGSLCLFPSGGQHSALLWDSNGPRRPVQHPHRGCVPDNKVSRSHPAMSAATVTRVVSCRPPKRKTLCTSEGQLHAQIVGSPQTEGGPWERPVWTPESPEGLLSLGAPPSAGAGDGAGFLFHCREPIHGRGRSGVDVREDLRPSVPSCSAQPPMCLQ